MQRARDSLTPLLDKRRVERQSAEQALAGAIAKHEAAAQTLARAEQALAAHLAKQPGAPTDSSASSSLSGHSLARAALFGQRHAETGARLKHALLRAHGQLAAATAEREQAQRALARASEGERAIEQRQARLQRAEAERQAHREQEAADEQAAAQIIARKGTDL